MLRYLRYVFLAAVAIVLLFLALANRTAVPVRLVPDAMSGFLGFGGAAEIPLFLIIFAAVAAGVLLGFVWEWFREMRIRGQARSTARKVDLLERELAVLKDSHSVPPRDEVLAILDGAPGPGAAR